MGRITGWSIGAERNRGYTREEVIGRSHKLFFTPEDIHDGIPERELQQAVEKGSYTDERWRVRKDGSRFWAEAVTTAIRDEQGTLLGFSKVIRNITERKQAEDDLKESRSQTAFLADLVENSSQPFTIGYADGRLGGFNAAFSELTGYSKEELMSLDWIRTLTPPEWQDSERKKLKELDLTGQPVRYEKEYIRKNGSRVPIELFVHVGRSEPGKPQYYYAFVTDIAERKQAENALREKEFLLSESQRIARIGSWSYDPVTRRVVWTTQTYRIFGVSPDSFVPSIEALLSLIHPDDRPAMQQWLRACQAGEKPRHLEFRIILPDGSVRIISSRGDLEYKAGKTQCFIIGTVQDITERKKAEETIRYQTYHDLLTGLPNRLLFAEQLDHEIHEMRHLGKRLAVFFLDIDHFKNVNDSLGHAAGETLIQQISLALKKSIQEFDTIARIGGDEFSLLLPLMNRPEDASKVADNIMRMFKQSFAVDHHEIRLSASIGISLYPEDGQDAESLLKSADIALHYAKDHGRDNYQFFNDSLNHRTLERMLFENGLRQAVEREELVVHYQPQRNLKTGKITGAEALVRWNHPDLGMLTPARFIPLAEETGLIEEIDQWVLRTVCRQLKIWETAGHALPFVTTNVSARQFRQPGLSDTVARILQETGLGPDNLGIEITETLAMRDTNLTTRNVNELNDMGVKLLIDDFGTGYSSLGYLKKLPLHKLKIDKSFITDLARDRDDQAITNAIIAMAHILKLKVVAEGVETKGQESYLESQNCDEMQGYLFSKPIPAGEFENLLVAAEANGGFEG